MPATAKKLKPLTLISEFGDQVFKQPADKVIGFSVWRGNQYAVGGFNTVAKIYDIVKPAIDTLRFNVVTQQNDKHC